jgi:hypothetical protein
VARTSPAFARTVHSILAGINQLLASSPS